MSQVFRHLAQQQPSMKVPPKRKGNGCKKPVRAIIQRPLNESPSEKEGKFFARAS